MIDQDHPNTLAVRQHAGCFLALLLLAGWPAMNVTQAAGLAATNTPAAIPWNDVGAKAGANYQGDGLAVTPIGSGARLHCVFQRLDGEATPEGLWLTSTVTNTVSDRFRVKAMEVGRKAANATFDFPYPESSIPLADAGEVSVCGQTVRVSRPGLTEEYSVSMDGVRQDFIVKQAPLSSTGGELVVKLAVNGAKIESAVDGARLVLTHSGRKIAYSRLRVTDATGKELPARIEVCPVGDEVTSLNSSDLFGDDIEDRSPLTSAPTSGTLAVVVNDAAAVYPVRIDPTFSDANWISLGGLDGTDGTVDAAVMDGSGNLYIGGTFNVVGNAIANNIAEWNGSSWSALGSGANNGVNAGAVYALAVSGGTLYAGGYFTSAGGISATNIAQWNGSSWSAVGSGIDGEVLALAVSGGTLYAGGYFVYAGGNPANYIAQWNGSSWSALGSGMGGSVFPLPSTVSALAVSGGMLYAGGNFTNAGGSTANCIAQWNGSSWSALGSGMTNGVNDPVYALAVSGGTLYAGGNFSRAGGNGATNIAQWNGSSWSQVGSGVGGFVGDNSGVSALAVSGGTLYAGGRFLYVGVNPANCIAQWNGSSWSALGSGISGGYPTTSVNALAVSGSTLFAGGAFTTAGVVPANYIAQWKGSSWSAVGSGMDGDVLALAVSGGTVYAGGYFVHAGGNPANCVAQWNGSSWSALGSGMGAPLGYIPSVHALAVSGSTLYAGGIFTSAGSDTNANNIAQWNGSSWSALGSGILGVGNGNGPYVYALAVSGGTLYAGGEFYMAGGTAANGIAQWNGSSWSALGAGISGAYFIPYVNALAVSGGTLYAGGHFTTAGSDTNANNIAQWNGSSWSALGSGMNGNEVSALAVSGGTLYAGGDFTSAGGVPANSIAQWNGSSWSPLGSGLSGVSGFAPFVSALAVSGGTLYAGGTFTIAGTNAANYIAQWTGSSWSALGSGMSAGTYPYGVFALAVSGSTLYAGGGFTTAGTNVSAYAAMAYLPVPPTLSIIADGANMVLTWPDVPTGYTTGYTLESATNLVPPVAWQTNSTAAIVIGGQHVIINPITGSQQFFRLFNP